MTLTSGPASLPAPAVALIILDGWGLAEPGEGNAVARAETPTFDELQETYAYATLSASGRDVGLPEGQMGNSEVGHLNLGAGSIVKQDLARIDDAVADGSFFENEALVEACERAVEGSGRLHLIGLTSDGGVHSGWEHIEAAIQLAADQGVPDLVLHALTDGRDTSPTGGAGYLGEVQRWLRAAGRIGTVGGRYYGMDRDTRWERTKLAFDAIAHAEGQRGEDPVEVLRRSYGAEVTDEFVQPTVIGDYDGVRPGDAIVTLNFRPDRMRQLVRALGEPGFDRFPRAGYEPVHLVTMTSYREGWDYPVAFPPRDPEVTLARVIAERGERQLHVAETEKYPHVTYFFNGGREDEWEGERHELVASPREVPTYDQEPEMSAEAACDAFCEAWEADRPRFGIINFANPDMVGHTGDIPAAMAAVEEVDRQLRRVVETVHGTGGACIVTADHGNAEHMLEPDGSPNTAHTTNPVPFVVTVGGLELRERGILADVSPTVLHLLGTEQPEAMEGESMVAPRDEHQ